MDRVCQEPKQEIAEGKKVTISILSHADWFQWGSFGNVAKVNKQNFDFYLLQVWL